MSGRVIAGAAALCIAGVAGPVAAQDARQPYLQQGTSNAVTVVWRSSSAEPSRVCYGSSPQQLSQTANVAGDRTAHEVRLTGLAAGERVYYATGASSCPPAGGGDADHFYDVAPAVGSTGPVRLWVVGDSGTGGTRQAQVRDAMFDATTDGAPDLFLHVGDMAYDDGTDQEFTDNFFSVYQDVLRNTVSWPAMGNHEGRTSSSGSQSGPYYDAYVLPTDGSAGGMPSGTEAYYAFDHANVHFVVLDSHDSPRSPNGAMLQWLEQDLAATDQTWIIAYWHHPPYSKGSHDSDSEDRLIEMRENALPILEAAGVDLVLSGHSHIYERSYLIEGAYDTPTTATGHIVDPGDGQPDGDGAYVKDAAGAVYVVAGHGGAGPGGSGGHPVMYFDETENGSCLIDIEGGELRLRNIRSDGVVSDAFTLRREGDGSVRPTVETVVPFGGAWEYYDQGDPGAGWQTGSGSWPTGDAQLGYGDGDETTLLEDTDPNRPSAYFRRSFELPAEAELRSVELRALYDDAIAVFVNGEPVWSDNTVADPDYASFATAQSEDNEVSIHRVDLTDGLAPFVVGSNRVAAIVKQRSADSSDLSFDMQIRVTYLPDPPPDDPPDSPDAGNDGSNAGGNDGSNGGGPETPGATSPDGGDGVPPGAGGDGVAGSGGGPDGPASGTGGGDSGGGSKSSGCAVTVGSSSPLGAALLVATLALLGSRRRRANRPPRRS